MAANATCAVRFHRYRPAMLRLRPLSEAECYARLYGGGEGTVTVVRTERRVDPFSIDVSGELLRKAFEERLDEREVEHLDYEAA